MNKNPIKIYNESKKFTHFFKWIFPLLNIFFVLLLIIAIFFVVNGILNIDQDVNNILSTTAGVTGSMFGLTAASYAFIWSDLRSDNLNNRYLGNIINKYRDLLWLMFFISLILTVVVIVYGFLLMSLAQLWGVDWELITEKASGKFVSTNKFYHSVALSISTLINAIFSILAVIVMVSMNYYIFRRDVIYSNISKSVISEINNRYSHYLCFSKGGKIQTNDSEYKKIHNLELLVERILDNHENIGSAFSKTNRRMKLLSLETEVIYNRNYKKDIKNFGWEHLSDDKRNSRYHLSKNCIEREFKSQTQEKTKHLKTNLIATSTNFVSVYDDLIKCRDSYLVYEEKQKKTSKRHKVYYNYERPELRCTVKKRLLSFFMRGEEFTKMDLSGISLSGADLQLTNFSGCNLSNIKLKGANCEGADFTETKMVGMYFIDGINANCDTKGEIPITCIDDNLKEWNPYTSHESTYFKYATFKRADISRANLNAPGKFMDDSFPYWAEYNYLKHMNEHTCKPLFSFEGTNFDEAKMFNSLFSLVNFDKSSLEKSQMYNTIISLSSAQSANFSNTVLTSSIIVISDFNNSNASGAILADSLLARNRFTNANLKNANFANSNLVGNNFDYASCQNASFKNISQNDKKFAEIKSIKDSFRGEYEKKNSFKFATLSKTDFTSSDLSGIDFSSAIGNDCIFTKSKGIKTLFNNTLLISSVLNHAVFEDSSFIKTVLRNSVLLNTKFRNCFFDHTDFSDSIFSYDGPCFSGGEMTGVKFENVIGLSEACFRNIKLINIDFSIVNLRKKAFNKSVSLINCRF